LPTSDGCSVGIVGTWTKATELFRCYGGAHVYIGIDRNTRTALLETLRYLGEMEILKCVKIMQSTLRLVVYKTK
jgi:hypothetical protein